MRPAHRNKVPRMHSIDYNKLSLYSYRAIFMLSLHFIPIYAVAAVDADVLQCFADWFCLKCSIELIVN